MAFCNELVKVPKVCAGGAKGHMWEQSEMMCLYMNSYMKASITMCHCGMEV